MKTFEELTPLAQTVVGHLVAAHFDAAVDLFDPTLRQALPADKLEQSWQQLLALTGPLQSLTGIQTGEVGEFKLVAITCQFEKAAFAMQTYFNGEGQIAGLTFQPTQGGLPYNPPAYVHPDSFHEVEVTFGSDPWALPGTLTLPNGDGRRFPAVVLVHGSGPNDRDETLGPNRPFRDLAWGLASRGVAVLRYDKRTFAHKTSFTPEVLAALTVQDEIVDDALQAVELLRRTPAIDPTRIFVLGHSMGAVIGPRIGQQDPGLAGLILLAGSTQPLVDSILEQFTYIFSLNGGPTAEQVKQLEELKVKVAAAKDPNLSPSTPTSELPLGMQPVYLLDLRGYHPEQVAASLAMPVLVLQGGRDYQVLPTLDFGPWQAALAGKSNAACKLYPALNHLFIPGESPSTPQEYALEGHVAAEVIRDIATWISK